MAKPGGLGGSESPCGVACLASASGAIVQRGSPQRRPFAPERAGRQRNSDVGYADQTPLFDVVLDSLSSSVLAGDAS